MTINERPYESFASQRKDSRLPEVWECFVATLCAALCYNQWIRCRRGTMIVWWVPDAKWFENYFIRVQGEMVDSVAKLGWEAQ